MLASIITASLLLTFACTFNPADLGSGVLHIKLTDNPVPWPQVESVYVNVVGVEIFSNKLGWETLPTGDEITDLMTIRDGGQQSIGLDEVPSATYTQLRLILGVNNTIVLTGEAPQPLTVPSGQQSGIKIIGNFAVPSGGTTTVVLDFDAELSIHMTGSGKYMMNPVVKIEDVVTKDGWKLVFFEDFKSGPDCTEIKHWEEIEHFDRPDKCSVISGSSLGGRMARIYGQDYLGTNHYFFRRINLHGYEETLLRLQAKRSLGWNGADLVFLEFFYEGDWHIAEKFNSRNTSSDFSSFEVLFTEEMMETEFYIRFRNDIIDENEYFDIDNIEILSR